MPTLPRFKFIAIIIFVIAFSPSLIAAQLLEQVDSLVVVDANQNRVGKVIDMGPGNMGTPEVPLKFGNFLFIVRVLETRFVGGGHGSVDNDQTLWFDEPGCTGQAYMNPVIEGGTRWPDGIGPRSIVGYDGGTVYMEDLAGEPMEFFDAFSSLVVRDNVPTCEGHPDGNRTVGPVVPTVEVVNLFTFFAPPFSLQAGQAKDLTALQQQVDDLSDDFTNHTHTYQTGKGRGQNRITVNTGPALPAAP